jgi:hypothetical protein
MAKNRRSFTAQQKLAIINEADQYDERESMKESLSQSIKSLEGAPGSDDLAIMKDVFSNIDNFEDIG